MIEATSKVVIAGYLGQMGHAMESLLGKRAQLCIWPIAPDQLEPFEAIGHEAAAADFLLICTPTVAHTAVLDRLAHRLQPECAVLSIAKGLDSTGRCAADILQSYCGKRPWGVLGGPMIANEIIAGKPAFAALGNHDKALFLRPKELFPREGLVIVGTPNPQAVSWCGVLKNIYAPLVGISDEWVGVTTHAAISSWPRCARCGRSSVNSQAMTIKPMATPVSPISSPRSPVRAPTTTPSAGEWPVATSVTWNVKVSIA